MDNKNVNVLVHKIVVGKGERISFGNLLLKTCVQKTCKSLQGYTRK